MLAKQTFSLISVDLGNFMQYRPAANVYLCKWELSRGLSQQTHSSATELQSLTQMHLAQGELSHRKDLTSEGPFQLSNSPSEKNAPRLSALLSADTASESSFSFGFRVG